MTIKGILFLRLQLTSLAIVFNIGMNLTRTNEVRVLTYLLPKDGVTRSRLEVSRQVQKQRNVLWSSLADSENLEPSLISESMDFSGN